MAREKRLCRRGDLCFGEYLEERWIAALDYGVEELNFIAAFLYEDLQFQRGLYNAHHSLEDEAGEAVEYICNS